MYHSLANNVQTDWEYAPPPNFENSVYDCETVVIVLGAEVDSSFIPKYLYVFTNLQVTNAAKAWERGKWAVSSSLCLYSPHHQEPLPLLWFLEGFQVWIYMGTVCFTTFGERLLHSIALYFNMWLKWRLEPPNSWRPLTMFTLATCHMHDFCQVCI